MTETPPQIKIRPALPEEHKRLCQIARAHRSTSAFSSMMFSGPQAYDKGWIRVAVLEPDDNPALIVGFTCVRHKKREPKTSLYYIALDPAWRHGGPLRQRASVSKLLLDDLYEQSPHHCIELSCENDNAAALAFYEKNGFKKTGEALKGRGVHLEKSW